LGPADTKQSGGGGVPDGTITVRFRGSAGHSFGAFVPSGITLELEGDANDYVGKGLSGGRIVVRPDAASTFPAEHNVIAGNVIGYGATGGEIFLRGMVGERFCVRNSGATAVVEGVGDHGCEYMTGGRVVVLGPTGRNFGAGMSGGIAYVYDPHEVFGVKVNYDMVDLQQLEADDLAFLHATIDEHHRRTGSAVAAEVLGAWPTQSAVFKKVMPRDYARVLSVMKQAEDDGLDEAATLDKVMEASRG
ncbi:MAG: glutamate synthase large subunit, partial [Actinomycetota bacterium]